MRRAHRQAAERRDEDPLPRDEVKQTAKRLAHIAELASIALDGNEPESGVEYLFDALELLRQDLRNLRHLRPRHHPRADA